MDISSIMGQCMYFGLSFSRIGVDFRAMIAPIFLRVINKNLISGILKVTKQFELDMDNYTLINKDVTSFKRNVEREHKEEDDENSENIEENKTNSPPESLLDFQPLAIYCNGLLNIFNELRVCSPIAIVNTFVLALETSLENVGKTILSFYRSEQQAFGMKEKENFLKMCSCFAFELMPYIQHCINLIFPPSNKLPVHNIEILTGMRSEKILEPIEHLLPDHFKTTKI